MLEISKPAIPMIGQAELIASIAIVTLRCTCKQVLMGQMGSPIVCIKCNRTWFVSAKMQITVQEVPSDVNDMNKSSLLTQ